MTSDEHDLAIETNDLVKIYSGNGFLKKNRVETLAVDGVNLSIRKGEIFGLLGPNGAGKTTTIKMLATILLPTSGKATVLGYDIWKDPVEIRKRINLVSSFFCFFLNLFSQLTLRAGDEELHRLLYHKGRVFSFFPADFIYFFFLSPSSIKLVGEIKDQSGLFSPVLISMNYPRRNNYP